jgi:uncharacterized membrane protein YfcA
VPPTARWLPWLYASVAHASDSERLYRIRRPLAAVLAGVAVAVLGGLIGLGGAEFRLPLLIAVFELYPHRAIRINLLISLATLAVSAIARLIFTPAASVTGFTLEIVAMIAGGTIAAWVGAGLLARIPKNRVLATIALLLIAIAGLLILETYYAESTALALAHDPFVRLSAALVAGLAVGAISSLLGVAGGELIIPVLMFIFGADIRTAGTASVLISTPVVLTGIARHWLAGTYRSRSMLSFLVLPMSLGSAVGALLGGYLAAWTPTDALKIILAVILALSALKLVWKPQSH